MSCRTLCAHKTTTATRVLRPLFFQSGTLGHRKPKPLKAVKDVEVFVAVRNRLDVKWALPFCSFRPRRKEQKGRAHVRVLAISNSADSQGDSANPDSSNRVPGNSNYVRPVIFLSGFSVPSVAVAGPSLAVVTCCSSPRRHSDGGGWRSFAAPCGTPQR